MHLAIESELPPLHALRLEHRVILVVDADLRTVLINYHAHVKWSEAAHHVDSGQSKRARGYDDAGADVEELGALWRA